MTEASRDVQIIATSQSADLLDRDDVDPGMVRAVMSRNGLTEVGNIDSTDLRTLDQTRPTLGELMRRNQVRPGEVA